MPTPPIDRARDLLSALEILNRHRNDDPAAYRAVHAATAAALDQVHEALLDPRGGDLDAGLQAYGDLARQLRALPRPTGGQPQARSGPDPLTALLGRRLGGGGVSSVESWMSEVATGISPNLEQAVRDGLRDLFRQRGQDDLRDDEDEADRGDGARG